MHCLRKATISQHQLAGLKFSYVEKAEAEEAEGESESEDEEELDTEELQVTKNLLMKNLQDLQQIQAQSQSLILAIQHALQTLQTLQQLDSSE